MPKGGDISTKKKGFRTYEHFLLQTNGTPGSVLKTQNEQEVKDVKASVFLFCVCDLYQPIQASIQKGSGWCSQKPAHRKSCFEDCLAKSLAPNFRNLSDNPWTLTSNDILAGDAFMALVRSECQALSRLCCAPLSNSKATEPINQLKHVGLTRVFKSLALRRAALSKGFTSKHVCEVWWDGQHFQPCGNGYRGFKQGRWLPEP